MKMTIELQTKIVKLKKMTLNRKEARASESQREPCNNDDLLSVKQPLLGDLTAPDHMKMAL